MALSLPASIAGYFALDKDADITRIADCFTGDAVVHDEAQTHRGHEAILAWQREAHRRYAFSSVPVSLVTDGGRMRVTAKVTGNFPGSPVHLSYAFTLVDGKIQSLEIG